MKWKKRAMFEGIAPDKGIFTYPFGSEKRPVADFFTLHQGIFEHPVFAPEKFTEREAFIWLIFEASYEECIIQFRNGVRLISQRGQLTVPTRFMAEKWGWKEPRVRRFLNRLESEAMIEKRIAMGRLIVTICDYEFYQYNDRKRDA